MPVFLYNLIMKKIVITGMTSSGKSAIIDKIKGIKIIKADDFIKQVFYKKGHPVYDKIVSIYGKNILTDDKIDPKKLGPIVMKDEQKLAELSKIVNGPFVEYINNINEDILVESATYMNYEKDLKNAFNKVILVTRDHKTFDNKFDYLKDKKNTIKNTNIHYDLLVQNNGTIEEAIKLVQEFIDAK